MSLMALKKEIKAFLKETNYTEKDIQTFWDELIETNRKCKQLHNSGTNWSDLNIYLIKQLPTQKEKDLISAEKTKKEEAEKQALELKEKQEKEYYNSHFAEIMISKIGNGEELTEYELNRLRDYSIEDIEGDESRWTRHIDSIIDINGRTFMLCWERGLTEYQENGFYTQPCEVEKKTTTKTIIVTEWVSKP